MSLSLTFEQHSSYYGRHCWPSGSSSRCASCDRPSTSSAWRSSDEWHLMQYVPSDAGLGTGREYVLEPPPRILQTLPNTFAAYCDYANYHPINSALYLAGKVSPPRCGCGCSCAADRPPGGLYGLLVGPSRPNPPPHVVDPKFFAQSVGTCNRPVTSSRPSCSAHGGCCRCCGNLPSTTLNYVAPSLQSSSSVCATHCSPQSKCRSSDGGNGEGADDGERRRGENSLTEETVERFPPLEDRRSSGGEMPTQSATDGGHRGGGGGGDESRGGEEVVVDETDRTTACIKIAKPE